MAAYLVTGGAGFIGSSLACKLISQGESVVVLDSLTRSGRMENLAQILDDPSFTFVRGSICDANLVNELILRHQPNAVINSAAETHVDISIDHPSAFIETNIAGVFQLLKSSLDYCRSLDEPKRQAFRFLQVSTDEVYGSVDQGVAIESDALKASSPYSASKAAADHLVQAYFTTYGLNVIVTRGCNTYGPRQFPEKFIPLLILRALSGKNLPVYGTGRNVREWLHVDDHVSGILAALRNGRLGEIYNIGSGELYENIEVAKEICRVLDIHRTSADQNGFSDQIEFVVDRPGHDLRYAMDSSKAADEIQWQATIRFADGLDETAAWYIANRSWWEPIVRDTYDLERLGVGQALHQ